MADVLPKLRAPSHARLVDDVCQSLEEGILSGQIKPGERLIETRISEHMGVSRTTVREALLMLERQGLVETRPRRGTFVTRLSRQDSLDVGFARALLEGYAVRVGFNHIDSVLINQLERCIEKMGACRLPRDVPELVALDQTFHRLLVETCGSRRISELWASLSGQIRALYITTLEREDATIDYVVAFHRELLDGLRSGDPQVAQTAIVRHYVRQPDHGDQHPGAIADIINQMALAQGKQ